MSRNGGNSVKWQIIMATLVIHSIFVSIATSTTIINGYSQWSNLLLLENKGQWNFLNESSNEYENGLLYNCGGICTDAEKCPTELTISTRELKTIPMNLFANCFYRLAFLNMSNCGITEISKNRFENATHLIKLDLSRNGIEKLPSNTFELASNIEIIDLSHNRLTVEGIDKNAFANCISLKQLDLSDNRLLKITHDGRNRLAPLKHLEVLNLNDNSIEGPYWTRKHFQSDISDYYNNTNLISLYAKNSEIENTGNYYEIRMYLPQLRHFIISRPPGDTKYQTNIDKYHNQQSFDINLAIIDVSGRGASNLFISNNFNIIIANHNKIQSSTIQCFEINNVVSELYISHNQLTNIDIVYRMPNLKIADFSSNQLQVINENFLMYSNNLAELNLANNQLRKLDFGILEQMPSLKSLDISHNNLNGKFQIDPNMQIEHFKIAGNQFSSIDFNTKTIQIVD